MRLSELIPVAEEYLWAGSKDLRRTKARAQRLTDHWNPTLEDYRPIDAIRALSNWSSFNRYRASLSSLLRAAVLLGFPRQTLPPLAKEGKPRDRLMTASEEQAMMQTALAPLVSCLLKTGMRLSEVYRARKEGDFIVLDDTKNGDRRVIPFRGELPVLPPERTLRRRWAALAPPGLTPHALRHTAITRWAQAGLSLPEIKALAGHRSTETSLRYLHLTPEHLAMKIDSLSPLTPSQTRVQ